ncbi:4'-phosphopantetheinyl transferase family protein [Ruegeria arenilitoris]|uniref:4'-phosphopantetheinyl transferase family protein n=1 Tax=Ruegeria arenilitoris TaxID=1173585 RepID=UPI00147CB287|nr:4'-phosphopantetheinyl transferase superfamily protein [Ruegeria arenilitoris]
MTDLAAISGSVQQILGTEFGVAATDPSLPSPALFPEEDAAIVRAVPKRRLEFAAGRAAARMAMSRIGLPPKAVPKANDRSPIWPEGLVGSITHCEGICLSVVARTHAAIGIGIDIEHNTDLSPDLENVVCRPDEVAWLDQQPSDYRGAMAKCFFCVKESAYKALYPITRKVIGFSAMHVSFNLDGTQFLAKTAGSKPMNGHVIRFPGHIICLTVIPVED